MGVTVTTDSLLRRRFGAAVLVLAAVVWAWVALRAVTPMVPDEYSYFIGGVELDRLDRLKEMAPFVPQVANYLFLRLINLMARAHMPVEETMKLVNLACFIGSAWLLGALVLPRDGFWRAGLLFALIAFHPTATYVAHLMPETVYLFVFTALFCLIAQASGERLIRLWAAAGALFGAMVLIKAHGVFALAAFLAATLAWAALAGRLSMIKAIQLTLVAAVAFGVTALAGKALLGPHGAGADVVGDFYWRLLEGSPLSAERLSSGLIFGATQFAAVLMLFAPSLAFLAAGLFADRRGAGGGTGRGRLLGLLALFLIFLMVLVLAASSYLLIGDRHRVLLRYVSFAFPCLLTLAWIWAVERPELDTRAFRIAAAVAWVAGAAFLTWRLPHVVPLAVDGPEMYFTYAGGPVGDFGLGRWAGPFGAAVVVLGALALFVRRLRWFDCQVGVLVVLFAVANANAIQWQGRWSADRAPARALGEAAALLCEPGEAGVVAYGAVEGLERIYPALTALGRAAPLHVASGPPLSALSAPPGRCIITTLELGDVFGPPIAIAGGVNFYRAGPEPPWREVAVVRFDQGSRPAMLGAGWSVAEPGGIWTDGPRASLRIGRPDPARYALAEFDAFAPPFRPSARVEVLVDGQPAAYWRVHGGSYRVILPPAEPGSTAEVVLTLPEAMSPAQAEPGNADHRLLGIAVRSVKLYTR